MANDPAYVRLVDRMARGCRVDISSGWSIAGLDVQPFPDEQHPGAVAYVRQELRVGTLEGCSKAEYEEVMQQDSDFLAQSGVEVKPPTVEGHYQEAHVVGAAEERRLSLEASRGLGSGGSLSYKDDHARRKAILMAQSSVNEDGEVEGDFDHAAASGELPADQREASDKEVDDEQPKAKRGSARSKAKETTNA